MPVSAWAQELEPGAYWPLPKGLNILTVVNNFNWGDVAFDPAAPIDEASARINTTALSFTRAFGLADDRPTQAWSCRSSAGTSKGCIWATCGSRPVRAGRSRFRMALNLYGAPAMTPQAFASYLQKTIVGVSVTVAPPLGQDDRQS